MKKIWNKKLIIRFVLLFMILSIPFLWNMFSSPEEQEKNTDDRFKNVKNDQWYDFSSPSGNITGKVGIDRSNELAYRVNLNEQTAILPSKLGLLTDKGDIGQLVEIGNPTKNEVNLTYPSRRIAI